MKSKDSEHIRYCVNNMNDPKRRVIITRRDVLFNYIRVFPFTETAAGLLCVPSANKNIRKKDRPDKFLQICISLTDFLIEWFYLTVETEI